ncbi:MAG: DNA/RNA non-specific endonuclease [Chloroherpetonaceae bacterium]|nr:DNA/RNA non-specific endonuclease [Chloroherpetonaceae bacterium]MDW8437292.1 DNA/RNA non-specific endonuclease [Chloroherpetonaceae bacterium]
MFQNKILRNLLIVAVIVGVYFLIQSQNKKEDVATTAKTSPPVRSEETPAESKSATSKPATRPSTYFDLHAPLGVPKDSDPSDDYLMEKPQYVLSYNNARGGANWVAWNLNDSWFGTVERRQGQFITDTSLPEGYQRITHDDYTGSGFDRGHMVRSEERTRTREDNDATFLMTNILPQYHDLNAGPWLSLEEYCEVLARKKNKELYIIAGGIYDKNPDYLNGKGKGRVAIPKSTWKIVVVLERGQGLKDVTKDTRVIAVNMPNAQGKEFKKSGWRKYLTTVDELERLTGYDFLSNVPADIQAVIESKTD